MHDGLGCDKGYEALVDDLHLVNILANELGEKGVGDALCILEGGSLHHDNAVAWGWGHVSEGVARGRLITYVARGRGVAHVTGGGVLRTRGDVAAKLQQPFSSSSSSCCTVNSTYVVWRADSQQQLET